MKIRYFTMLLLEMQGFFFVIKEKKLSFSAIKSACALQARWKDRNLYMLSKKTIQEVFLCF